MCLLPHARDDLHDCRWAEELKRAATLSPESETFVYAYAVGLHSSGQAQMAIRILEQALAKHPRSRDLLIGLATFHRDAANAAESIRYARRLSDEFPEDSEARALLDSLQHPAK